MLWLNEAVGSLGLLRPARVAGVWPCGASQQIVNLGTQQKVNEGMVGVLSIYPGTYSAKRHLGSDTTHLNT